MYNAYMRSYNYSYFLKKDRTLLFGALTCLKQFRKMCSIKENLTSVKYNAEQMEWIGSPLADLGIDITKPFGEYLLDGLKLHSEKLIQVSNTNMFVAHNKLRN